MTKAKPYLLAVGLQFGFAGAYIISMASINHGMNRFVLIVYRNLIAAVALAPFALIFERCYCYIYSVFTLNLLDTTHLNLPLLCLIPNFATILQED